MKTLRTVKADCDTASILTGTSRRSFLIGSAGAGLFLPPGANPSVQSAHTPNGGLQPQAVVDSRGGVHLIYLHGDPAAADIYYVRQGPDDKDFGTPIRVNDRPGSAVAIGTVRGAHLALGKFDRVHVAWNGSSTAEPKGPRNSVPMLYTRINNREDGFEPQRNVMTTASGLDGGGALAADARGDIYVAWHARGQHYGQPIEGEGNRRVWLARSIDNGLTFTPETPVSPVDLGACGCCGMGAVADRQGNLYLLYRTARETTHRDMYLLTSRDRGSTFEVSGLQRWEIGACPMSTVSLALEHGRVLLSWETRGQIYYATIDNRSKTVGAPVAAPGEGGHRKHPSIAGNQEGQTLLVWTEGTGWKRGGALAWQVFDAAGRPQGSQGGSPGLPAWDFAAAIAKKNRFLVMS